MIVSFENGCSIIRSEKKSVWRKEKMELRKYRQSDCKILTELFYHTVHTVNAKDYTEEQLEQAVDGNITTQIQMLQNFRKKENRRKPETGFSFNLHKFFTKKLALDA